MVLDEWIVMPDHVHGILIFQGKAGSAQKGPLAAGSLGAVIGQFKQRSKKRIRSRQCPDFAWQERFFDQILRDDEDLERYRVYIRENPHRWRQQHASGSVESVETPQSAGTPLP